MPEKFIAYKPRALDAMKMSAAIFFFLAFSLSSPAWDYTGHRMVSAAAIVSLPEDFPEFARNEVADTRVQFLAGEPDRWRNLPDPALRHINEPDHYMDFEELERYGLTVKTLPDLRNELLGRIYVARAQEPAKFATEEPDEDVNKTHLLFGLLPYAINENFLKLKSEFTYLRNLESNGGAAEDIAQARQNVLYTMGVLSHFVGDGAQPLHTTIHHHGWVGKNPRHYTRDKDFHSSVDGGFIYAAGIVFDEFKGQVKPAKLIWPGDQALAEANAFPVIMAYLDGTFRRVVPLYKLKKQGKLDELHPSTEGRAFIEEQLLRGGGFLGDLYYSAYLSAKAMPIPVYK